MSRPFVQRTQLHGKAATAVSSSPNARRRSLTPARHILGVGALILASSLAACGGADGEGLDDELVARTEQALGAKHRFGMIGEVHDLDAKAPAQKVFSPNQNMLGDIVGIAREPGEGGMFCAWYADWEYSCGTSWGELDNEIANTPFVAGEDMDDTAQIIGIAMATAGFVYTWTADGMVHAGTYDSPAANPIASFLDGGGLVDGKHSVVEIVGIAMDDNFHVYTYFSDGEYIEGTIVDLDSFSVATTYYRTEPGHKTSEIIDVAMMGDGHAAHKLYSWHHDIAVGQSHFAIGNRVDAAATSYMRRYRIPGMSLSISKGGHVVHTKGYGYRDFEQHLPMNPDVRCGIASVSKVITALAVMKQHELGNIDATAERIFDFGGTLRASNPTYEAQIDRNQESHSPIVGVASYAFAGTNRIATWYESGKVGVGTYTDPDIHGSYSYVLPAGKTPADVMAMAYSTTQGFVAYYRDGTFSRGLIDDLGALELPDPDTLYGSMGDLDNERLVGVDENHLGQFVWWRSDGKYAIGDHVDPTSVQGWQDYFLVSTAALHKDHIRGVAASKISPFTYTYGSSLSGSHYVYKGVPANLSSESEQADGAPWYENEYEVPQYAYDGINPGHWYHSVTPYHLLTHTAGVSMYLDTNAALKYFNLAPGALTTQQVIEYSLHHKKVFTEPGDAKAYSNYGFTILGELVSAASGTSLEQNIDDVIQSPLGLSMTTCDAAPNPNYDTVVHAPGPDNEPKGTLTTICSADEATWLASSGWMASTFDLVKLMLATDQNSNHLDVLDPATLDLMETPAPTFTDQALGWATYKGSYYHDGSWQTGHASIRKFPADYYGLGQSEMSVAICANGGNADGPTLRTLSNAILRVIVGPANIAPTYDLYNAY